MGRTSGLQGVGANSPPNYLPKKKKKLRGRRQSAKLVMHGTTNIKKRSLLLCVRILSSLLVTRLKVNTKLIFGRFKCEGVDSIGFVKDRRRFLCNRVIQLYLRAQKSHVANYQLPLKILNGTVT